MSSITRINRPDFGDEIEIAERLAEWISSRHDVSEDKSLRMRDESPRDFRIYTQLTGAQRLGWGLYDGNLTMLDCDKTTKEFTDKALQKKGAYPTLEEMMEGRPRATAELEAQWQATKVHGYSMGNYQTGSSAFVSYMLEVQSPLPMLIEALQEVCEEHCEEVREKLFQKVREHNYMGADAEISRRFLQVWNVVPAMSILLTADMTLVDTVRSNQ